MRQLAIFALLALAVLVEAVYLPRLYERLFMPSIEKTHLLFSPVTRRFIFSEKVAGSVPPEVKQKSEDHHAEIAYRDADGTYYTRVEFEKNLPFIYYKNMELWGLMPLQLGGREFDKSAIEDARQVLELKPGEINDRRPQTPLWPLLESEPGQVRLVFPEDRFRMTADAMEFINADTNSVDASLTALFTGALKDKGFVFPARSVNGKFTILKPFDEGAFIVDAGYRVFHIKRRNGRPVVIPTGIDPALRTRHIKISENKHRQHYGLLLSADGDLHLLTCDGYRLIRLPLENYDPYRMEFKLIINPLYPTAVWSDEAVVQAVAMDRNYHPLDRYSHGMSRAAVTPMHRLYDAIFPFSIHLSASDGGYLRLSARSGGWMSIFGLMASLAGFTAWNIIRKQRRPKLVGLCLVAATGLYGWIAFGFLGAEA
jgi:hypothetical protein